MFENKTPKPILIKTYNPYFLFSEPVIASSKNFFSIQTKSAYARRSTEPSEAKEVNISNKNQTQKKCLHSIYIFPEERDNNKNRNILKLCKTISANVNKVFYMYSNENKNNLEDVNIEDESKEYIFYSKKEHENQNPELSESIRNIQTDKAKRWKLSYNGSKCHMFVLHSNCSKPKSPLFPLRKKLGRKIENETIKDIANFLGVQIEAENASKSQMGRNPSSKGEPRKNKNKNQKQEAENETNNAVSKVSTKRKDADQSLGEKSKKPRIETEKETEPVPITYKTQEAIAEELYKRIKAKLMQHCQTDLEKKFDNFEFLIILPSRCSIEEQTTERIKEKFKKKDNPEKNIVRILDTRSKDNKEKWETFIQKAKDIPETFFRLKK
jgi:hypothetical protein